MDELSGDGAARGDGSVGRSTRRPDAGPKVRGTATYGTDLRRDDALHAGVVRSEEPHAELVSVDVDAATDVPGVVAAVTRLDLPGGFDDRVRHCGDVVAAVAAETREAVAAGLDAVDYDLAPLPSVHDPAAALGEDAPAVQTDPEFGQPDRHPRHVENPAYVRNVDDYHAFAVGDAEAALDAADHVHAATYRTPRVTHCNLDRHCCLAEWDGDTLEVTGTIGNRGHAEETLERLFDGCEARVRQPPYSGSSFGGRSLVKLTLEPVAATLARAADRPVRLAFDRAAEFTAADARHPTTIELRAAATADGDLVALTVDVVADTGPYPNGVGHIVLGACRDRPLDLYRVENYRYEGVSAFTNNTPAGEYRGIGATQIAWALESHLDELAREAGFDPVEFRRRNWVAEGDEPPNADAPISSCGLAECLDRGRETFADLAGGADDGEGEDAGADAGAGDAGADAGTDDAPTAAADEGWLVGRGVGVATQITTPAVGPNDDYAEARVVLAPDGTLAVHTGAIDVGQGALTVLGQLAADATGVPLERVTVAGYDPDDGLDDKYGSIANRTTYLVGGAVQRAGVDLRESLRARGAERLAVPAADLTVAEGRVGTSDGESVPVGDLLAEPLAATGRVEATRAPLSFGVHFAEVAVDPGTGAVDLRTYVAAQDVGYAINPALVEGQLAGAVEHGVEFATLSALRLDEGVPENPTLAEYPVSSPAEMPDRFACELIESNEASGPHGAKGVGTPAQPPVAPAITNAIRDAVGVRFTEAPVRDEDVLLALRGAER